MDFNDYIQNLSNKDSYRGNLNLSDYPELKTYVKNKVSCLCRTAAIMMNYICSKRDGYVEVSKQNISNQIINFPLLNKQLIDYILAQIYKVNMKQVASYDINLGFSSDFIYQEYKPLSEQLRSIYKRTKKVEKGKIDVKKSNEDIEEIRDRLKKKGLTGDQLETKLKSEINKLLSESAPYIHPDAIKTIFNYARWIISNIIPDANVTLYDNDIIYRIKEFEESLETTQNVIKPQDRGFTDDQDNIALNSILWLLCGIVDWLDKDTIEIKEFAVLKQILLGNVSSETTDTIEEEEFEDASKKIYETIVSIQLYANPEVIRNLTTLFFTLRKIRTVLESKLRDENTKNNLLKEFMFKTHDEIEELKNSDAKLYKQYQVISRSKKMSQYVM